jgi:hypothetical protein
MAIELFCAVVFRIDEAKDGFETHADWAPLQPRPARDLFRIPPHRDPPLIDITFRVPGNGCPASCLKSSLKLLVPMSASLPQSWGAKRLQFPGISVLVGVALRCGFGQVPAVGKCGHLYRERSWVSGGGIDQSFDQHRQ